jgi:MYXO-CTERM domain-containing protein
MQTGITISSSCSFAKRRLRMALKRSHIVSGIGILCFVGAVTGWLVTSGKRAAARDERGEVDVVRSLTQTTVASSVSRGTLVSSVRFAETDGVVKRASVLVDIESPDPRHIQAYLVSPSGMKVLVADGARGTPLKKGGIDGWFGTDGVQSIESLAAFTGEPVNGAWTLTVSPASAKIKKWGVTAEVGSNASLAGIETYGEYNGNGGTCDCDTTSRAGASAPPTLGFLLAGLALFLFSRRRRS